MTPDTHNNQLLEDFRNYLAQTKRESFSSIEQPDLNTLLAEMAALKTEVKVEARLFKTTLDTLSSALTTVQDDNKILSAELAAYNERFELQEREIMRTVLLDIIDIYDRISTGVVVLQNYRPNKALFKQSRDRDAQIIKRIQEGQMMTARHFEQLLQRYQVRTIDCVGKLLDPVMMTAVETGHDPALENGIVLEELRKGFFYRDQVLRLAEVKVNKTNVRKKI